jgi:prepilin-type N-terminal cleavage/methylation domain-containing protein
MKAIRKSSGLSGGFTLIEIMAAVAVLGVLVLIMGQIVGLVSDTWIAGKARVDNFTQARLALGLLDRDIQSMVLRSDVAAFKDENGADACGFYTRVLGSDSAQNRSLSLVLYTLGTPTTTPKLLRTDYGLNFDSSSTLARTMTLGNTSTLPDLGNADANTVEVANGVILYHTEFIDSKGVYQSAFSYDYNDPSASTNTRVMVVSMVVLDEQAYTIAETSGALNTIITQLDPDTFTPGGNKSYADAWREMINASSFSSGLPLPVLRAIRVFERSIEIPLPPAT